MAKGRKKVSEMTKEEQDKRLASGLAWQTTKSGIPGLLALKDNGEVDTTATIKAFTDKLHDYVKLGLHKKKSANPGLPMELDPGLVKEIKKYAVPAWKAWTKTGRDTIGINKLVEFCFARLYPDLLDDSDKKTEIRAGLYQIGFTKTTTGKAGPSPEVKYEAPGKA